MINRYISVTFWALILFVAPLAFGQTFSIVGRSGATQLKLDETIQVTFQVNASGLTQPVVPVLVPLDSPGSISTTWTGTAPTSSTNSLTFNVHAYNDEGLCGQVIDFELRFYSNQFTGFRTASGAGFLAYQTNSEGSISLDYLVADMVGAPRYPLTGDTYTDLLKIHSFPQAVLDDPNTRVYWYVNWFLNGYVDAPGSTKPFNGAFNFFVYYLNTDCYLRVDADMMNRGIGNNHYLDYQSVEVIDRTNANNPVPVQMAPLGGTHTTQFGNDVNIFDITDVRLSFPACGNHFPADVINYNAGPYTCSYWYFGLLNVVLREFRLYLGHEGGCSAQADNFGTPPGTQFAVHNISLTSEGNVSAVLDVPSAWGTATTLNSNFRVQWYLRTSTSYTALGGETQSLNLNATAPLHITSPENYFLEAQVRKVANNSKVSVTNRNTNHYVHYQLQVANIVFDGAEPGQDDFLDPGETIVLPYRVSHPDNASLPTVNLISGVVIDDGDGVIDSGDLILTSDMPRNDEININLTATSPSSGSGAAFTTVAQFELLTAPEDAAIWFFFDSSTTVGGENTGYRQYFRPSELFDLIRDINAEDTHLDVVYDFFSNSHVGAGWTAMNGATSANSGQWAYPGGGPWVGDGGLDVINASDLYQLISPAFPIGSSTRVDFRHKPQFTFNQSGGMLEYAVQTGTGPFSTWTNINLLCTSCNFYNSFPFPTNFTSYLAGKRVWMSNESSPLNQTVIIPDSLEQQFPQDNGNIKFRYVFSDPGLVDTGRSDGPTHWEMYKFEYQTEKLLEDNYFGVNLNALTMDFCDDPAITFTQPPVPVSSMVFEWYENLNNLYAGTSNGDTSGMPGTVVPFTPATGTNRYFVRIKSGGTERIIPVFVTRSAEPCADEECLTSDEVVRMIREDAGAGLWPDQHTVADCVVLVNRTCLK